MLTQSELDKIAVLLAANNEKLVLALKEIFVEQKTAYKWATGGMVWAMTNVIAFFIFCMSLLDIKEKLL